MKKYFILAAAAAMFAACSSNNDLGESSIPTQETPTPLLIGTSTGNVTVSSTNRSSSINLQDDYAVDNTTSNVSMGLYILKSTFRTTQTDASAYERFNLKTAASLGIVEDDPSSKYSKLGFGTPLYYPDQKSQDIDVYVYAPINENSGEYPTSTDNITTKFVKLTTNATQTYDEDYYANDFLWGCVGAGVPDAAQTNIQALNTGAKVKTDVNITANNAKAATAPNGYVQKAANNNYILVPMIHLGSKIIVKVKTDTSMPIEKLKNAKVTFRTDIQSADLDLSTGALSNTSGTNQTAITIGDLGYSANGTALTAGEADGRNGVLWDSNNDDTDSDGTMDDNEVQAYLCAGVILPQTVSSYSSGLIQIKLSDSSTTYLYKPNSAPEFKGGKKYTYEITVKASGLEVTTSVQNWEEDTWGKASSPETGNATLE